MKLFIIFTIRCCDFVLHLYYISSLVQQRKQNKTTVKVVSRFGPWLLVVAFVFRSAAAVGDCELKKFSFLHALFRWS